MGGRKKRQVAHENQRNVEVLVVLLDVVRVIVGRLPLVDGVEVEARVVVLDRFEERSEGIMEATSLQWSETQPTEDLKRTISDLFAVVGSLLHPFLP